MKKNNYSKTIKLLTILVIPGLIGACSTTPTTPPAEAKVLAETSPELAKLMERVAIEEFFYDYYAQFRPDSEHDFASFFTDNGRLEVNGMVFNGLDEIKAIYDKLSDSGGEEAPKAEDAIPAGGSEMIVTNMKIDVQGDKAVATFIWQSITAELVTSKEGKIVEYGRERTELVKQNGRWLIRNRVVLTEGGMPESLLEYYPNNTY